MSCQEKIGTNSKELENLKKVYSENEKYCLELNNELERVNAELRSKQQNIGDIRSQIDAAKQDLTNAHQNSGQASQTLTTLKAQTASELAKIQSLEQDIDSEKNAYLCPRNWD